MCTVVLRWHPGEPVRVLALRDELVGREFDDPGAWWPEQPDAVGGRDRTAGGTWCATDVRTGTTALVLNRPERRAADPGAPSRGVLPLRALQHGPAWHEHVPLPGMASFALVLVSPQELRCWAFDGQQLREEPLREGTAMVTSGGAEDGKALRHLPRFADATFPDGWRDVLRRTAPEPDTASLVVRLERDASVYATVFGQLITSSPRALHLSWARQPWGEEPWQTRTW